MKKYFFILLLLFLVGCKNDKEEELKIVKPKNIKTLEIEEVIKLPEDEEEDLEGKLPNPLTGLYVDEEIAIRRPAAIVFNNLSFALPQSGISQGELYYEVLAESGITRIIALAQKYTSERIGSVRSARHYFLDFALDNDAIFVHHGGSSQAYNFINNNGIKDINGDYYDGIYFYRDSLKAQTASREHTSYTRASLLEEAIVNLNIEKYHSSDYKPSFKFFDKDTEILYSSDARELVVPFSDTQISKFIYDEDKKLYYRFQNGEPHIDEETNEQLFVRNIIIQNVNMTVIDNEGRRDVYLVGEGSGYIFSNGKYAPITWRKDSHFEPTKWYDKNGDELRLNKGKSWICVFQNSDEIIVNQ